MAMTLKTSEPTLYFGDDEDISLSNTHCKEDFSPSFTTSYEILKEIGVGGFGTVYQVQDKYTRDSTFAVKVLNLRNLEPGEKRKVVKTIESEVNIMRQLKGTHRNIINFYDIFYDDGAAYKSNPEKSIKILMEYPVGTCGDLFDKIMQRGQSKPNESELKSIFLQTVDAVAYLHRNHIMHRDIKPENVLLVSSPRDDGHLVVKLLDFGLAKKLDGTNQTRTHVGSKHYTAPEVEVMRNARYDDDLSYGFAADSWSLGSLLYVMFSSEFPSFSMSKLSTPVVCFPPGIQASENCLHLIKNLMDFTPSSRLRPALIQKHIWCMPRDQSRIDQSRIAPRIMNFSPNKRPCRGRSDCH